MFTARVAEVSRLGQQPVSVIRPAQYLTWTQRSWYTRYARQKEERTLKA